MNAKDIHKQAEKARKRAEHSADRQHARKAPKTYTPQPADGRYVFHRIYPHTPNRAVWMFLPLVSATIGATFLMMDWKQYAWLLPYVVGVSLIPVLAYLFTRAREWWNYPAYKAWCKEPPFPLHGWDKLGKTKNFPRNLYWNDSVMVTVTPSSGASPETIRLIKDMLYLFCRTANTEFYSAEQNQAGLAGDIRNHWKKTGELAIAGSADGSVMGKLYLFLSKQLAELHEQTQQVAGVQLSFSQSVYKIEPERTSD